MLNCQQFYQLLTKKDIDFFSGVPDSLLKDICAYITDNTSPQQHIIAANEGNAIALAAVYHLATGKVGLVYLQNSGLGNCVNPLTSLTASEVYSIPLLLLMGWRGEPGKKDEPQHQQMGRIMLNLLKSLEIPYSVLSEKIEEAEQCLSMALVEAKRNSAPYALIVKEGTFESYALKNKKNTSFSLNREQALGALTPLLHSEDIVISTTGKTSRELFELRKELAQGHDKDFLTVGSMGHASSIALGIALQKPQQQVYCFDGDGAAIMHMGAFATIGKVKPHNFRHIIFNNFAHDSVGGQPTAADAINLPAIALANGYKTVFSAETEAEIRAVLEKIKNKPGPILLEIRCNKGARDNLGRPTRAPLQNKKDFMNFLHASEQENH